MAKNSTQPATGKLVHIYSTLTNPQMFTTYVNGGADLPVVDRKVQINGGTGIASRNLITTMGVHTGISLDDYEAIKDMPSFKKFVEDGFIVVEGKEAAQIERVVSNMNIADPSSPLTPSDFTADAPQDGSAPLPVDLKKAGTGWVLK